MPVGTFVLPNGSNVWMVRHRITVTERMREHGMRAATVMTSASGCQTTTAATCARPPTHSAFMEIAVTIGDPDSNP